MNRENYRPDSEINHRALIRMTLGLVLIVIVALLLVWKLTGYFNQQHIEQDPPPPIMLEARVPHEPPSPRLQSAPFAELAQLESAAQMRLNSYGWSDEARGLAHIPIDRAMDLLAENGFPETPIATPAQLEQEN